MFMWGMGHWRTEDPLDKGQSLLPREGRDARDKERNVLHAELWTQGGYLLFSRDEIEVGVNSAN